MFNTAGVSVGLPGFASSGSGVAVTDDSGGVGAVVGVRVGVLVSVGVAVSVAGRADVAVDCAVRVLAAIGASVSALVEPGVAVAVRFGACEGVGVGEGDSSTSGATNPIGGAPVPPFA